MNIKNEKPNEAVQEVVIEISKDDYAENVETTLKKQRKTAKVPGFRDGNAPMGLIKRMYEKAIVADEVNDLVSKTLNKYIKDNELEILLEPLPIVSKSSVDFEKEDNFVFCFEIALQPAVDIDYEKMPTVKSFAIKASKEEIDNYIDQLRNRHGEYSSPETIADNDYISVKYDDKEGFFFSKDLSEEGKKQLIGKKLNDELDVSLRDILMDSLSLAKFLKVSEKELDADDQYRHVISISNIGRIIPAEINEEFFKKAFPDGNITNKQELTKEATEKIESQWKNDTDRQFMNDAIETLLTNISVTFPDDFIKKFLLETQKDMTPELLEEKYPDYQKSFKWQLIESKIVKDNNIQVSIENIKEYIRKFFIDNYFYNFKKEDINDRLESLVNESMKKEEDVKKIYDQLFDEKLEEVLKNNLKTEQLSGSLEDFMAYVKNPKEEKPTKKKAEKTKKSPVVEEEKKEEKEEKKEAKSTKAAPKEKKTTKKK